MDGLWFKAGCPMLEIKRFSQRTRSPFKMGHLFSSCKSVILCMHFDRMQM